ncbi:MAG: SRPBCC family protein [Propionibacteriaceae bacterium]
MIDIAQHLQAVHREVSQPGEGEAQTVAVTLRRTYHADPADVWDALTTPERLARWFSPVSGDLRAGGSFQVEGNASGDILECAPPARLRLTYGGPESVVEVRLTAADDATILELDHQVPLSMAGSVAGSLYVGPGWDEAFLQLALYIAGETDPEPLGAATSPQAEGFSRQSVEKWIEVTRASGLATEDEIGAATEAALAQFAPETVSQ